MTSYYNGFAHKRQLLIPVLGKENALPGPLVSMRAPRGDCGGAPSLLYWVSTRGFDICFRRAKNFGNEVLPWAQTALNRRFG
jgi:hypothetical protein